MDLLSAIKDFYDKLFEIGVIQEKVSYDKIEETAEEVYNKKYNCLSKYVTRALKDENYFLLKEQLNKIKEIVKNDR